MIGSTGFTQERIEQVQSRLADNNGLAPNPVPSTDWLDAGIRQSRVFRGSAAGNLPWCARDL